MAALQEQLRQDCTSLRRFVASIAGLCSDRSGAATYLEPAERFFKYIQGLAAATDAFLDDQIAAASADRQLLNLRSSIRLIRAGWRFMHEFIKPVLDSHTLQLPAALVAGLTTRLREVPGFSQADFVIYHTDRFNYLNVTLSVLKARANQISGLVKGPEFPPNLGLIGIPYSQSSSVFMNCLIPHEMGHYVFGERQLKRKLQIHIERELIQRLASSNPQVVGLLVSWAEEIFCDLFAVKLVGFCFSLAFVELFDCGTILDEWATYSAARAKGQTEFSEYPPDPFRLSQQVKILDEDGWWSAIKDIDSHYIDTLKAAMQINESQYSLNNFFPSIDPKVVLASFFSTVPQIFMELDQVTHGLRCLSSEWRDYDDSVALYLTNGIVPSTIGSAHRKTGQSPHPHPVCLLNSSYKFYVQRLNRLLTKIEGAEVTCTEHRVKWSKRVESWAAKAIEDVLLIPRETRS